MVCGSGTPFPFPARRYNRDANKASLTISLPAHLGSRSLDFQDVGDSVTNFSARFICYFPVGCCSTTTKRPCISNFYSSATTKPYLVAILPKRSTI